MDRVLHALGEFGSTPFYSNTNLSIRIVFDDRSILSFCYAWKGNYFYEDVSHYLEIDEDMTNEAKAMFYHIADFIERN